MGAILFNAAWVDQSFEYPPKLRLNLRLFTIFLTRSSFLVTPLWRCYNSVRLWRESQFFPCWLKASALFDTVHCLSKDNFEDHLHVLLRMVYILFLWDGLVTLLLHQAPSRQHYFGGAYWEDMTASWPISWTRAIGGSSSPSLSLECMFHRAFSR